MANYDRERCLALDQRQLERVNYFTGQLVAEEDMTADQEYFLQKHKRHNRYLHGWGVVCGLEVIEGEQPMCVTITSGYALGPYGDEIYVPESVCLDLASCGEQAETDPCDPERVAGRSPAAGRERVYVAIQYAECLTAPRWNGVAGCGCEEECRYYRVRDSFKIVCLDHPPPPGEVPGPCDFAAAGEELTCPGCPDERLVLLAEVSFLPLDENAAAGEDAREGTMSIDNDVRQRLHSTAFLQECCCGDEASLPGPANLRCRGGSTENSITIAWDYAAADGVYFRVERWDGTEWNVHQPIHATSFTESGLTENTTYRYRVSAVRQADGEISQASEIECTTAISPPVAPTGLHCRETTTNSITIAWNYASDEEVQFVVERRHGGNWIELTSDGSSPYRDTGLDADTAYDYHVFAIRESDGQHSSASNVATCRTQAELLPDLRPVPDPNAEPTGLNPYCRYADPEVGGLWIEIKNVGRAVAPASVTEVRFQREDVDGNVLEVLHVNREATPELRGEASHTFSVPMPEEYFVTDIGGSRYCTFEIEANADHDFEEENEENNTVRGSCPGLY